MPPPEGRSKDGKSSGSGAKSKDKGKGKGRSSGSSSKSSSKQSVAEIKADEYEEFVKGCPESHAGWLSSPLINISTSLSISLVHFSILLFLLLTLLLLLSRPTWIPHISSPIVLLIPIQNTMQCISQDKRRGSRGTGGGTDMMQWMIFWVAWVMLDWMGEMVRVFRPGWRGVWEIGRVGAGVVLGGPWFGKEAMIAGKPSGKLAEAEKREKGERAKAEKEEAGKARGKAESGKKPKIEKPKDGVKSKGKEKDKSKEAQGEKKVTEEKTETRDKNY